MKPPKWMKITTSAKDGKLYANISIKRWAYPWLLWKALRGFGVKWYQWPRALYCYVVALIRMYVGTEVRG